MTRDTIISIVKSKMDELTPFDEGLIVSAANQYSKPVHKIISDLLNECANDVQMIAPLNMVVTGQVSDASIAVASGVATVTLPADYLRTARVKFPGWEKQVYQVATEGDQVDVMQQNPYTRAGMSKPVVVYHRSEGKLKCYKVESKTAAEVVYVKTTLPENLKDNILEAYTWHVVAKAFITLDMPKQAEVASSMFTSTLQTRSIS